MRICVADLDRETTRTLAEYIKQGGKLTEGFTIEAPGKGVVDESIWSRAKKAAEEQGQGENYAYISSIYQSMGGEYKKKSNAYPDAEDFDDNPKMNRKHKDEPNSELASLNEDTIQASINRVRASINRVKVSRHRSDFNPNLAQDEEDFDRQDHKKPEFGSEKFKTDNGKSKTPEGAPSKLSKRKVGMPLKRRKYIEDVEGPEQYLRDQNDLGYAGFLFDTYKKGDQASGEELESLLKDPNDFGAFIRELKQRRKSSKHISISRHLLDQTFHFNPKTSKDLFDSQTVIQASMIGNDTLQYRNLLIKGDFIGDDKDVFVPTDYSFSTEMAEMHQARKEEAANIVIANYPQVIEGSVDLITQIKNKLLKGVLITDTRLQRINTKRVDSNGNFRDGEVEWVMVAEDPLKHTSANLYLTLTAKNGSLEDTGFFRDTLGKYYTLSSDSVKQLLQ